MIVAAARDLCPAASGARLFIPVDVMAFDNRKIFPCAQTTRCVQGAGLQVYEEVV